MEQSLMLTLQGVEFIRWLVYAKCTFLYYCFIMNIILYYLGFVFALSLLGFYLCSKTRLTRILTGWVHSVQFDIISILSSLHTLMLHGIILYKSEISGPRDVTSKMMDLLPKTFLYFCKFQILSKLKKIGFVNLLIFWLTLAFSYSSRCTIRLINLKYE